MIRNVLYVVLLGHRDGALQYAKKNRRIEKCAEHDFVLLKETCKTH